MRFLTENNLFIFLQKLIQIQCEHAAAALHFCAELFSFILQKGIGPPLQWKPWTGNNRKRYKEVTVTI